jgi:hypothetical protein
MLSSVKCDFHLNKMIRFLELMKWGRWRDSHKSAELLLLNYSHPATRNEHFLHPRVIFAQRIDAMFRWGNEYWPVLISPALLLDAHFSGRTVSLQNNEKKLVPVAGLGPGTVHNFKSSSVTAPSEALVTWAAYFASTPRV